jgi:taurine transport system substrate-binding protein
MHKGVVAGITLLVVGAVAAWPVGPASDARAQAKPEKIVIGFQSVPNEEIIAKQLGWHEKEWGVKVEWKNFDSGRDVNTAMVAGSIDFGLVGSSPAANGLASGVPYEVIWIYDIIAENEALVVRKDRNIKKFSDLAGKKVAAPFGSTTHYHLLVAFKVFNLDPKKATILDMQPPDMLAAWQRGDIDAGFVWEPTLIKMRESGGEILVTSKELADKGFITADVAVVRKAFADKHPDMVQKYVLTLSKAVDYYRQNPGEAAKLQAKEFNLPEAEMLRQMKTMIMLNGKEQLDAKYLGACAKRGAFAKALKDTADFLKAEKRIKDSPALAAFEKGMNPCYLEKALK